jgi:hypothetical protein
MEIVCWCCWILTIIRWGHEIKKKGISSKVVKMRSAFIELLHEDGRTEINKGTERHIFLNFFPELTQTVTQ